jgi:hypothetical protein
MYVQVMKLMDIKLVMKMGHGGHESFPDIPKYYKSKRKYKNSWQNHQFRCILIKDRLIY